MVQVPGFPSYFVDLEAGRVLTAQRSGLRELKAGPCGKGYLKVGLMASGKRVYFMVHRLVAWLGLGERASGMVINHRNGDKRDNRLCNLEYVTPSGNNRHACAVLGVRPCGYKPGAARTDIRGAANGLAKLTDEKVREMRRKYAAGEATVRALAREHGINYETARAAIFGRTWRHV